MSRRSVDVEAEVEADEEGEERESLGRLRLDEAFEFGRTELESEGIPASNGVCAGITDMVEYVPTQEKSKRPRNASGAEKARRGKWSRWWRSHASVGARVAKSGLEFGRIKWTYSSPPPLDLPQRTGRSSFAQRGFSFLPSRKSWYDLRDLAKSPSSSRLEATRFSDDCLAVLIPRPPCES